MSPLAGNNSEDNSKKTIQISSNGANVFEAICLLDVFTKEHQERNRPYKKTVSEVTHHKLKV